MGTQFPESSVKQACTLLLDFVNGFYTDPKNQEAYEAWKSKEANNEDHDHH